MDKDEKIKAEVARHQKTSPASLALLSKESSLKILENVASNVNTPTEALDTLAAKFADNRSLIGGKIALNPNLSEKTLKKLLESTSSYIRGSAMCNPNNSVETLKSFAKTDMDSGVLRHIAEHKNVTTEILIILSQREDTIHYITEVLKVVASHPKTPFQLAENMAQHSGFSVREWALNHPEAYKFDKKTLWKLAKDSELNVLGNLASKPFIPIEIVNYLAKPEHMALSSFYEENVSVRLARHPKCSAEMAAEFSQPNRHRYVRSAVCSNPLLTHNRMRELFNEQGLDYQGKINLAGNPNLPADLIEQIIENKNVYETEALVKYNPNLSSEQLHRIVHIDFSSSYPNIHSCVIKHPSLSHKTLEEMLLNGNLATKCAIARWKKTAPEILLQLAQDHDFAIRDAVFNRQNLPLELLPLKRMHDAAMD